MANTRWLGRAEAVRNIQTITVADTWAADDTATLTINGRDLVLTVGSTVTTTQIAADIVDMWNGDDLNNDESRNTTGDLLAEFAEIEATVVAGSSVVTLTHQTDGVPFTITVSETTAGDGNLVLATTQAATGPNDVNNAANWSEGSVPSTSDVVFIDDTEVSLLYNVDQLSGNTLTSTTVGPGFAGRIGLPETNENGYTEYRPKFLAIDCSTVKIDGTNAEEIKIDSGTVQTAFEVINGTVIWKGSHVSNTYRVYDGDVQIAPNDEDVGKIATININGGSMLCGLNVTLTTLTMSGECDVDIESNIVTVTQQDGNLTVRGTATMTTYSLNVGTCDHRSNGTITTLNLGGHARGTATFDRSGENRALTITTLNGKPGSTFNCVPNTVTVTNGIAHDSTVSTFSFG